MLGTTGGCSLRCSLCVALQAPLLLLLRAELGTRVGRQNMHVHPLKGGVTWRLPHAESTTAAAADLVLFYSLNKPRSLIDPDTFHQQWMCVILPGRMH